MTATTLNLISPYHGSHSVKLISESAIESNAEITKIQNVVDHHWLVKIQGTEAKIVAAFRKRLAKWEFVIQ